jgi:endonuclease/exonuclease/phosphatase family metal-dependent hydrolase
LKNAPGWRQDFSVLVGDAREVTGPRLAVGDFNATLDHGPMRDLMATGLRSAAEEANSGWQPTWPTAGSPTMGGVSPFRLMAIDHVLLSRELSAVSTDVASVPGTDHHAVIARVVFR